MSATSAWINVSFPGILSFIIYPTTTHLRDALELWSWDGILSIVDSFLYWTNWGESESKNEAIHEALTLWIAEMAW